MSLHRMSAGNGFAYLLKHTASADTDRNPRQLALVDNYTASGNPPGHWAGSGLPGLNDGRLSRYQHVVDELRRDAADLMGAALWPELTETTA